MSFSGTVNQVNLSSVEDFLEAAMAGKSPPSGSFASSTVADLTVNMILYIDFPQPFGTIQVNALSRPVSSANGSFTLPDIPAGITKDLMSISLTQLGKHLYRTEVFSPSSVRGPLDIFLLHPPAELLSGADATAGRVSKALASANLPSNTFLQTLGGGSLMVFGSKGGADINLIVTVVPDVSPNVLAFLDLQLSAAYVTVGGLAALCTHADDVLAAVKAGLSAGDSPVNAEVRAQLLAFFSKLPGVAGATRRQTEKNAKHLLANVSVQFLSVENGPVPLLWPATDTTDPNVALTFDLALGFPNTF